MNYTAKPPSIPEAAARFSDSVDCRHAIRAQEITGSTDGMAPGYVQANLCILPRDWADEFLLFCQRNPKPCPLLAVSDPGSPLLPELASDLDIRSDVPSYRVFRDGELAEEVTDIHHLWRDDLVTFALGCSFSFEQALVEAGLPMRHWERDSTVPMYLTNVDCAPAGRLHGNLVVSMRPFKPAGVIRAVQITSRFPMVHGAPIHVGMPEQIGIPDVSRQWLGGDAQINPGELPVFWACGVTPRAVVLAAKIPFCLTHKPGSMLITDQLNISLASF